MDVKYSAYLKFVSFVVRQLNQEKKHVLRKLCNSYRPVGLSSNALFWEFRLDDISIRRCLVTLILASSCSLLTLVAW
jgi:hypothetical protein